MRSRLTIPFILTVSTLVLAGCSGGSSGGGVAAPGPSTSSSGSGAPAPSGTPSGPSPTTSPSPQNIPGANRQLSTIVLTASEVGQAGQSVEERFYPAGLTVRGQATLDECHASYSSESKRAARIQVIYTPKGSSDQESASNEVVRYRQGGAALAYRQITHSLRTCPSRFPEGHSSFGSDTTIVSRDPKLPAHQVTATQLVTSGKQKTWSAISFLYEGDLFSGIYVFRPTRTAALAADRTLAEIATTKLQAAFNAEGTPV